MVPSTAIWSWPKMDWSRITDCFRNNFALSAARGRRPSPEYEKFFGWTGQTIEKGRNRWERPGPAGLEKFDTKPSRGPQHFTGPPKNRNGYYSKQKNSSMRLCGVAGK